MSSTFVQHAPGGGRLLPREHRPKHASNSHASNSHASNSHASNSHASSMERAKRSISRVKEQHQRAWTVVAASDAADVQPLGQQVSWKHIMVALIDANPMLGTDSRLALTTAASLAMEGGKLTVVFFDEVPCSGNESRMTRVKNELDALGLKDVQILEEEIGDSAGGKQQSVAVGEAADTFRADLVVMSTSCVHEKHVDANLLAEFVPAPLLLLP